MGENRKKDGRERASEKEREKEREKVKGKRIERTK